MQNIKKFAFTPFFLASTIAIFYNFKFVLDKYLEVFFGTWGGLYELGILALFLTLASLFYCLYITFTQDFKYALVPIIISAFLPFIFLNPALSLVLAIGFSLSLLLTYFNLMTNLKSYVTFLPVNLLSGPIKTLTIVMLLALSFGFYFHSNSIIQKEGFKVPDPLINWAIDLSLNDENPSQSPNQNAISIIPSMPTANLRDIVKAQVSNSLDQILKPYLFAIPMVLAFLFFSLTSFALWIISLLLNPLILLIFYILEKSGFVRFEKEMREVKKLVV